MANLNPQPLKWARNALSDPVVPVDIYRPLGVESVSYWVRGADIDHGYAPVVCIAES
ncbi:hypothetical protein [Mycobacterium sp. M23085]|uniref:hypothetical protein n=1 Tax=Mycobacterium sp. M23085 TaxID=3378087 RepID=UPI003877F7DA